ncbi:TPA_asm: hypothetical protein G0G78_12010 [Salmonella enterica]|nr:hypothetical protein [Salmonella enterica]HAC8271028.1 hypothetical protein [Salmonella enterica]
MKIEYQYYGAVANVVITSTVFEFRKHNHVVDTALFSTLGIVANRSGMFFMKTVLPGKTRSMLRTYKTIPRETA